ncbi:MAG: DUF971 domain-containing protein [Candidatus Omnitrophica bacterium]|nr:DUF971 domain-containing protein [Candidatus Omnitrophota bacterium]
MAGFSHEPKRIERIGNSALKISWMDGHESIYLWEKLRRVCPCAVCRESGSAPPMEGVKPLELQPVGRYALTIRWSDGHATGIFSHEYLRSLCGCEACQPIQLDEG